MAKVAIIGAGIAGCATALLLYEQGHEIHVFEARDRLDEVKGAGLLLQPAGLSMLKRLGLYNEVMQNGARISSLFGCNHKGQRVLDLVYAKLQPHYHGLGIERQHLFKLLQNQLEAQTISIEWNTEITTMVQHERQVDLQDQNHRTFIGFNAIVVANGRRSSIHLSCGIWRKIIPYPWGALWTLCRDHTDATHSQMLKQTYAGTQKMLGILPVGKDKENFNRASLFWSLHNEQFTTWQNQPISQWKEEVLLLNPNLEQTLLSIEHHEQLNFASYNDIYMKDFHKHRVIFIGDAAHAMSPQLGQGANLALTDAALLADCLSHESEIPKAYANYTKLRKHTICYYQRLSRLMTPLFQSNYLGLGKARDVCLYPLSQLPLVNRLMLATLACLKPSFWRKTHHTELN